MTTATLDHRPTRRARAVAPLDLVDAHTGNAVQIVGAVRFVVVLADVGHRAGEEFRRAFRARFGKTPATARAEFQIADMKTLLRQGVPQKWWGDTGEA